MAIDLDGTLFRTDGTLSIRTVNALAEVTRLGHEVVFATGRTVRDMDRVGELTGHLGRTVCANGAAIYDHSEQRVTRTHRLSLESLGATIEHLSWSAPDITLAVEDTH